MENLLILKAKYEREALVIQAKIEVVNDLIAMEQEKVCQPVVEEVVECDQEVIDNSVDGSL